MKAASNEGPGRPQTLKAAPWMMAFLAIGVLGGLLWAPRGDSGISGPPGMSRAELDQYVEQSFVQILDKAFRSAGVLEAGKFSRSMDILVVAPDCAPSSRALKALRQNHSRHAGLVLVSALGDEEWIRALDPELPIAETDLAELVRTTIPVRVGPTLIQTRLRTVVGFRLGLTSVLNVLRTDLN